MCLYSIRIHLCGHTGIPQIYSQCAHDRNQLYRIYDPREPRDRVPYNAYLPQCEPGAGNCLRVRVESLCGGCSWRRASMRR